jgi:hypothetical protein
MDATRTPSCQHAPNQASSASRPNRSFPVAGNRAMDT